MVQSKKQGKYMAVFNAVLCVRGNNLRHSVGVVNT